MCLQRLVTLSALAAAVAAFSAAPARGQTVLFDFENAPVHTSLPLDVTVGGITAHLSATGQGFSIQDLNGSPIQPLGFAGHHIYPNSVFAADLLVSFSRTLTAFSILYAPQELGCDDSATMRVTAYMDGVLVGSATKTAQNPGTYPSDTLACAFAQGFNSVVVHYDKKPPTCTDWGPIFLADNMQVTATAWADIGFGLAGLNGVPSLLGSGTLAAGSAGALSLDKAKPAAKCLLMAALASAPVPFKGGVLAAFPPVAGVPLVTSGSGSVSLPFTWPAGVPAGTSLWFQVAVADAAAVHKVALSNALEALTP